MEIDLQYNFNNYEVRIVTAYSGKEIENFYSCYYDIFIESYDYLYDFNTFIGFVRERSETTLPLLGYINDKPAIFRYIRFDTRTGMCYVPWGGVIKEFRGNGLYPDFCERTEQILVKKGIETVVNECENPDKVKDKAVAISRLKMFTDKLKFQFIPSTTKLPYLRNEFPNEEDPSNANNIQEEYILGFKHLKQINKTYTQIHKKDYLNYYMSIRDFEFQFKKEDYINLPATQTFIKNLNEYPKEYIKLIDYNKYATN